MSLPGLRPKIAILLTALAAAGATTDPTPAAADIFFRPFFGYTARRFVVEAEPELSPREVVAILARRGYRLAEPLAYRDDVIIAIGADPRGRLTRFVLDVDDGEVLERRRLHREPPPPAPVAARPAPARKRAVETAARPAPHRVRETPAAAAPVRPAPHKAAAEPPARPATRSAAPTPPAETGAVPAGAAKAPPAETSGPATPIPPIPPAPAPATPPVVDKASPPSPAAAAPPPEPAAPAAQWKAPSE